MSLDRYINPNESNESEWYWIKAKDFMEFNPKESVKKGTLVKNVPMDKIEPNTKEISNFDETEFKGGVKFRNGDTLMARITPCLENGKISQVNILNENEIGCGSTEFIVLREKEGISDKDFIYYLSRSDSFKEPAIKSMVGSSGRQRVQRDVVENLDLYVPPLKIQKKIGEILSFFDKKITLNKQINKNLINISKSIFRQKFLNYEGYEDFKDTDYGRIPSTFDVFTLNEISKEIVCGKTPSTKVEDNYGDKMPFITIPDMHNNVFIIETERKLSEKGIQSQKKKTLPKNSICVSCIATAGLVSLTYEESQTNQQINSIICKDNISPYFMYLYLNELSEYIKMLGSGGSTTLNLNKNEFSKIKVAIPNNGDMNKFNDLIEPIFNKIKFNQLEIIELTKLRDTLLPKLMNGEINVSKINCDLD